jgi:saccharopine dehydrogenase-like NADP-dependent oxidoreductase
VGSPAAIAARWLAGGRIDVPGVKPPEQAIDPPPFYEELARRGVETSLTEETVLAG